MHSSIKVLYVENNQGTRESFYKILKKRYFDNVTCAVDGLEGLNIFITSGCDFDLVISDIVMRELNGVEMLSKMKKLKPSLTTMLISGNDSIKYLIHAIEIGVDRFLMKPINFSELDNALCIVCKQVESIEKMALLQSEADGAMRLMQEYKKAVDESTIFSIADLKGRIKYANKPFREISGYTLEELQGKPHSIVRHPDMPKESFKQLWETIANKQTWRGVVKNKTKNGDAYYVKATIVPILDDKGNITEYAGIRDDITELVQKEEQLRQLKDKQARQSVYKALSIKREEIINNIPFPALFVDENTHTILCCNPNFYDIFIDPSFLFNTANFDDLLLKDDPYIFSDGIYSFDERFALAESDPKVAFEVNGIKKEFAIGITKKEDGFVVVLFELGAV